VGGLVQFDGSDVCISTPLGLWFDDVVSASLFGGFWLTLLTEAQQTEKMQHSFSKAML
jgi:hypothetical protein